MNLIVGSTGLLGGEICRRLAEDNQPVRALVRSTSDPAKVAALDGYGVETVTGDVRDCVSLEHACHGVKTVLSTVSALPFSYDPAENNIQTVDHDGLMNLISAAGSAGVEHFIYISFTMDNEFPLRDAKRAVERSLKESGLNYTILRPSYFMEFWLSPAVGFDAEDAKVQIYGSGENPISWISYKDVGHFAIECINNPLADKATLKIGGPEALSQLQSVQIFEQLHGKPFELKHIPEEALEAQLQEASDPAQKSFSGLMLGYARGDKLKMQEILQDFPIKLKHVREYAEEMLVPA